MNRVKNIQITISNVWHGVIRASWKKKLTLLFVVVVALWFVIPKVLVNNSAQPQYQTQQAERGTLIISVTGSGQVSGANSTPITTQLSGVVEEVYAGNGSYIETGKPIAKITLDQDSQQKQSQAYASYLTAVSQLKTAQQTKESNDAQMWQAQQSVLDAQNNVDIKNGNTQNPTTKKDYTDLERQSIESQLIQAHKAFSVAEQKYKESDNSINAAQASLNSAWIAYQQTSNIITAPISGTVSDLSLKLGTIIGGSSSTSSSTQTSSSTTTSSSSSTKVGVIKTSGTPTVLVNLSEIDIPKVKVGNRATLTFDAFTGKTFTGKVTSIDSTGSVSSGVVTYPVTISLDTDSSSIFSNMTTSANIITDTKDDVVLVPSSAVQTQDGQSTVRILKKGVVTNVTVEVGASSDTQVEILSGITEGDAVVTSVVQTGTAQRSGSTTSVFGGGLGGNRGVGGGTVRIQR